jgi:uncharacterized membrane protein YkgB
MEPGTWKWKAKNILAIAIMIAGALSIVTHIGFYSVPAGVATGVLASVLILVTIFLMFLYLL